jgi:signal transduction histidine kinase
MDRAVGALSDAARADQSRGVADIEELASRFREASGMPVTVAIDSGVARALSQRLAATAHRLVSEGLTNIWRHAPAAASATVEIAGAQVAGHPAASITVRNVLAPASPPLQPATRADRTGGLGLVGLRERVEALGGQLRAGPTDAGWELRAVVPLERDPSSK